MATGAGRGGGHISELFHWPGFPLWLSGARTAIHWLVRSTGPALAILRLCGWGEVSLTHVLLLPTVWGLGNQWKDRQRCRGGNREETGLWALNAHPTTTSGPNDWHPSGFYRGKQSPPQPRRVLLKKVLSSAAPGLTILLQGELTFPHQWR